MKILHLIDSLDYHASARQVQLLGPALADERTTVEVCCLGLDTPWSASLRQANVAVHALGWTRWFDFSALWNLREILRRTTFDVIHVWRLPALRALAIVAKNLLPRVVMSAALPTAGKLAWWDRRLLAQVRCLTVAGVSDQDRCERLGITAPVLRVVPPAVEKRCQDPFLKKGPDTFFRIACVGGLERPAGFRQAIWAFDFVRHVFPDAALQVVGAGSQLVGLRALAHGLECHAQVQFLGAHAEAETVLRDADIVWAPSQANTGRQVALEAMSRGRVVIASDVPCLREVLQDGATGYLIPVGDVVQTVRRTNWLLQDGPLRERIGEAARQHVQQHFPLDAIVARWRDVYRSVAAKRKMGSLLFPLPFAPLRTKI